MTTLMRLGGINLPMHDPDPDERDHRIIPGEWAEAGCADADRAQSGDLMVWSSLTDIEGRFGSPCVYTCWGSRDGTTPIVAGLREPNGSCRHAIFRPAP